VQLLCLRPSEASGLKACRSSAVATHPGTRRVRGKALNYM